VLVLRDANRYIGFSDHPAQSGAKPKQVVSATIVPYIHLKGWVELTIKYHDGTEFYSTSQSERGAKQQFAFQCSKGSKWDNKNGA